MAIQPDIAPTVWIIECIRVCNATGNHAAAKAIADFYGMGQDESDQHFSPDMLVEYGFAEAAK